MPGSFPGGFLCLETAGDDAGNELLLGGPCLPPGRAGGITREYDLGFTLPLASQEDVPLLDSGLILPSEDCISAAVAGCAVLLAKARVALCLK